MASPSAPSSQGLPNRITAGLDITHLDTAVEFFYGQSLAPASQRSYQSAQKRYLNFCSSHSLPPFPITETHLCRFVSLIANDKVGLSSIKVYLSALRKYQVGMGMPDPQISTMSKLEGVLGGIKRWQASCKRLPITKNILQPRMEEFDNIMLWAAMATCFFGFLRSGELTVPTEGGFDTAVHLCFGDPSIDNPLNPSWVKLRLKASKTDPLRKGVDIVVGLTGNDLCPVTALLAYAARRGKAQGPLFQFENHHPLTPSQNTAL